MAADFSLDPWRFYGDKKLADVDIILAEDEEEEEEEQPAAGGAPDDQQAALDSAAEAEAAAGGAKATDGSTAGMGAAASGTAGAERAPAATDAAGTSTAAAAATVTPDGSSSDNPAAAKPPPAAPAVAEAAPAEAKPGAVLARSSKRKRQDGEHIFGHALVLSAFSGYCRTKLLDWDDATEQHRSSSSSGRARHEIQLLVPAGQLELGRLLIKGMYQQQPDLSDVSQAQLIQLLLLADRFEVPKVQAAVSAAFKALPVEQLQWDTVVAVYALPAGCAELAACQDLFSAVATKLQHELGDLELVLTEPESSEAKQLLELPFGALKQLLQDERTRVSSENTVFYAIQQWHKYQQRQIRAKYSQQQEREQQRLQSQLQQARELLQLVRMPQCSQLFIATVIGQSDLAAGCFSQHELLLANSFAVSATAQRRLPSRVAQMPVFERHPAWLLRARPPSAMKQLTIKWRVPLAQLKEAFERHLLETRKTSSLGGGIRVWQGLSVRAVCQFARREADGSTRQLLAVSCHALLPKEECRSFRIAAFRAESFKQGVPDGTSSFDKASVRTNASPTVRCSILMQLDAVDSWAEAELVLTNKGLVGSDGCLHLTMTVSDVE